MKINNLDPKKYKRFFAFGCSFTSWKWLTWADIIGREVELYQNWAEPRAGNYFIFNSFIEANARYNFNKDDLVIVFWSTKEREDRYSDGKWIHATSNEIEEHYGKEWVMNYFFDLRSQLLRDVSYMSAVQTILKSKECDWANLFWYDFFNGNSKEKKIYQAFMNTNQIENIWKKECKEVFLGNSIADFIDNNDVIKIYQDVFTNISGLYQWFATECIRERFVPDNDPHPTPIEALKFLDWVWPNNTLSDDVRAYTAQCESMLFDKFDTPARPAINRL